MEQGYKQIEEYIESIKSEVKELEVQCAQLIEESLTVQAAITTAKENKDEVARAQAEEYVNMIYKELDVVFKQIHERERKAEDLQKQLDDRIQEMNENPEVSEQLNEELENGYQERISQHEDKEEKLLNKADRLENLKLILKIQPECSKNLTSMLWTMDNIREIEKTLADPKVSVNEKRERLNEIAELQEMFNNDKAQLMNYIKQSDLNIEESDIDEVAQNGFFADKNGRIDYNLTIDKNLIGVNREILSTEADINSNRKNRNIVRDRQREQNTQQSQNVQYAQRQEFENVNRNYNSSQQQQQQGSLLYPVREEPKWYQFVKRFKNWREDKKISSRNESEKNINDLMDKEIRLENLKKAVEERPELKKKIEILMHVKSKEIKYAEKAIGMPAAWIGANTVMLPLVAFLSAGLTGNPITFPAVAMGVGAISAGISKYLISQKEKIINNQIKFVMDYIENNNINVTENDIKAILGNPNPLKSKETIEETISECKDRGKELDMEFERKYGYSPIEQRRITEQQFPTRRRFRNDIRVDTTQTHSNNRNVQQRRERDTNDMER